LRLETLARRNFIDERSQAVAQGSFGLIGQVRKNWIAANWRGVDPLPSVKPLKPAQLPRIG